MLAQKTRIKNLGHDAPDFQIFLSHDQAEYKLLWEKFNPAMSNKHMWLSGCAERSTLLDLLNKCIIILDPAQP
jgi:hypothetical protein